MTTEEFILKFRETDVRRLALEGGKFPEVDIMYALNQIQGWQTARKKLPSWASADGIIYPPHLNMEQCSSETAALYKASVVVPGGSMADLTGGFGVDFSFLSRRFADATYIESNAWLCEIARHNFRLLGLDNTEVLCGDSVEYLKSMKPVDFIYIDPARRDSHGTRTYAIEDCTPDVRQLQSLLLEKAGTVMIKLSPMLDWHKAVQDMKNVCEVHVVSVDNECKELLLVLKSNPCALTIHCINGKQKFVTSQKSNLLKTHFEGKSKEGDVLLVPNSSVMKAGVFAEVCEQFNIRQISPNSHLFINDSFIEDFPGRQFLITRIFGMGKKDVKELISTVSSANISTRNFPLTPEQLRKKLKLRDGGKDFLFATTDSHNNHVLLLCQNTNLK